MPGNKPSSITTQTIPERQQNRSYGGVLTAAFRIVTRRFKTIARSLWLYAAAYAIVAAYVTVGCVHNLRSDVAAQMELPATSDLLWAAAAVVLMFVAATALYGRIGALLVAITGGSPAGGSRLMPYMVRSLAVNVFVCVLTTVVAAIAVAAWLAVSRLDWLWIIYAVAAVAYLLLLPYIYAAVTYLAEGGGLRHLLGTGYTKGLRHYGFIFITWLLTTILTSIVSLVVCLPMLVLLTALGTAVGGAMMGDELGLPSYFYPLMYVVTALTFFILTAVTVYTLFVYYYMAGSIDTRSKEEKKIRDEL